MVPGRDGKVFTNINAEPPAEPLEPPMELDQLVALFESPVPQPQPESSEFRARMWQATGVLLKEMTQQHAEMPRQQSAEGTEAPDGTNRELLTMSTVKREEAYPLLPAHPKFKLIKVGRACIRNSFFLCYYACACTVPQLTATAHARGLCQTGQ